MIHDVMFLEQAAVTFDTRRSRRLNGNGDPLFYMTNEYIKSQRHANSPIIMNIITGLLVHRRIQDFVRGGGAKALLAPGGGGQGPLGPRLTIWGSNILWEGGGGPGPLGPPLDPRMWLYISFVICDNLAGGGAINLITGQIGRILTVTRSTISLSPIQTSARACTVKRC